MMNNMDSFMDDRIFMCDAINLHVVNATVAGNEITMEEEVCLFWFHIQEQIETITIGN